MGSTFKKCSRLQSLVFFTGYMGKEGRLMDNKSPQPVENKLLTFANCGSVFADSLRRKGLHPQRTAYETAESKSFYSFSFSPWFS